MLRSVLETRHVDAILLLGDMRDQPRLIEDLQGSHVPVVALWQGAALHGVPTVSVDNRWGIERALEHLMGLGHRRIAFISGRPLGDIEERQAAYQDWALAQGADLPRGYLQHVPNDPAAGERALGTLLRLADPPTAVVCSTDQLAIGVLHGAATLGVRVPDDLSVTGFDDLPLSVFAVPALTTVRMPVRAMAARAVEMAIKAVPLPGGPVVEVLRPELIVRASSGPFRPPAHDEAGR